MLDFLNLISVEKTIVWFFFDTIEFNVWKNQILIYGIYIHEYVYCVGNQIEKYFFRIWYGIYAKFRHVTFWLRSINDLQNTCVCIYRLSKDDEIHMFVLCLIIIACIFWVIIARTSQGHSRLLLGILCYCRHFFGIILWHLKYYATFGSQDFLSNSDPCCTC